MRTIQTAAFFAASAAFAATSHAATIDSMSFDVDPVSTSIDATGPEFLDWGYFLPNADFLAGSQADDTDFDALKADYNSTTDTFAIDPATNSKASPGIGIVTITPRDVAEYTNGDTGKAWSFTVNDGTAPVSGTQNPLGAANGIAGGEDIFTITFNDLPIGTSTVTLYMDHTNNGRRFDATVDLSASDGNDSTTLQSNTIGGDDDEGYFSFTVEVSSAVANSDLSISIDSAGGSSGQFQFAGYTVTTPGPQPDFAITEIEYDPGAEPDPTVTLTWRKTAADSYIAKISSDMMDWEADIGDSLFAIDDLRPGDPDHITMTLALPPGPQYADRAYFRIEEE